MLAPVRSVYHEFVEESDVTTTLSKSVSATTITVSATALPPYLNFLLLRTEFFIISSLLYLYYDQRRFSKALTVRKRNSAVIEPK